MKYKSITLANKIFIYIYVDKKDGYKLKGFISFGKTYILNDKPTKKNYSMIKINDSKIAIAYNNKGDNKKMMRAKTVDIHTCLMTCNAEIQFEV